MHRPRQIFICSANPQLQTSWSQGNCPDRVLRSDLSSRYRFLIPSGAMMASGFRSLKAA